MSQELSDVLLSIRNHKLSESIQVLDNIIKDNNKNYAAYHLRGICFYRLSKYENAKKDFNNAILLQPFFPEAYNNLGLLYFTINENQIAIENYLKSIDQNKNFKPAIFGLIKTLSFTKNIPNYDSIFISKHNEINKIKIEYHDNKFIDDQVVKKLIFKSNEILEDNFQDLEYNYNQLYRRTKSDLDCYRHKKVFNTYNAIPKFCFSCFKVQIELENVIDLIKLYIIFDNIHFKNNNTKKCLIETRPNIPERYKGLIYCSSIEEAEIIKKEIIKLTKLNLNKDVKCITKKGCTEFGIKYPEYSNLSGDAMKYKSEWESFENIIDKDFPDLTLNKNTSSTIKGVSLDDIMIIRNWLAYADLIEDHSYKKISEKKFQSNFLEKKLKLS